MDWGKSNMHHGCIENTQNIIGKVSKLEDFCAMQILREIKLGTFGISGFSKTAILPFLATLNLEILEINTFKCKILSKSNFTASNKWSKLQFLIPKNCQFYFSWILNFYTVIPFFIIITIFPYFEFWRNFP